MKSKTIQTKNITKRLSVWVLIVAGILLIPLLGKAPWTSSDYVFTSVVLLGCASVYEIVTSNMNNKVHKIAVGCAIGLLILLIWAWAVA